MLKATVSVLATLLFASAAPAAPPRPAPPLQFVAADGSTISLAALKGKVVIVEWLLTTCPACQESARILSKLQAEFGPQGLQVVGLAIDPEAPLRLREFTSVYATTFPVGMYGYVEARKWLEIPEHLRMLMPVIAVVDRAGMIREQHPGDDSAWMNNKDQNLRALLKTLLAEKPAPAKKAAPARKAAVKK